MRAILTPPLTLLRYSPQCASHPGFRIRAARFLTTGHGSIHSHCRYGPAHLARVSQIHMYPFILLEQWEIKKIFRT